MAAALLPDPLRDLVEPFLPIPTRQPKGGRPRVSGSEGPPEPRADQIAIDWTDCQLRSETPEARRVDAVFVSHALALRHPVGPRLPAQSGLCARRAHRRGGRPVGEEA